jgi:predicted N-acyltransferase
MPSEGYAIRVVDDPGSIDAAAWAALLAEEPEATPFVSLGYLRALHDSRSAVAKTGWTPCFLLLERDGVLRAAAPLYAKTHSRGEYVFDWAWANAYHQHGLAYYPKLLDAVPFTPVPGPRLLARSHGERVLLLQAMEAIARDNGFSSAHVLFLSAADRAAAEEAGWSLRSTVQFHWTNRADDAGGPWRDLPDFLASLQREKRKKIQQERRRVADAGVVLEARHGRAIGPDDWEHFHRCYVRTYREHGNAPYLTRDFFARMEREMPENWVLFTARRAGERIAASLVAVDPGKRVAFGRYWGATEHVPFLHFEACYYAPLAWCLEHGYRRFEGGAQGEHKMARGLLPVATHSAHWLADPRFARAVDDFLAREGEGVAGYLSELDERTPFKKPPGDGLPDAA